MELSIQGSKNKASGKYFVFISECERNQIKLINPEGKVLTVPAHIFEDPEPIGHDNFDKCFTPEQLDAVQKQGQPKTRKKAATSTTRAKKAKKVVDKGTKTGLGSQWDSDSLTFFKHLIEPLQAKQTFRINLPDGVFEMSKDDFQLVFGDVILSSEYSIDGSYSLDKVPERALKYLKTNDEK